MDNRERELWVSDDLNKYHYNSFIRELVVNPERKHRRQLNDTELSHKANLVSSRCGDGKHRPVIDLDYSHEYEPSSQPGHAHLYLNRPISYVRWVTLMVGLYSGKAISGHYLLWALRRRQAFVRPPWVKKTETEIRAIREAWDNRGPY